MENDPETYTHRGIQRETYRWFPVVASFTIQDRGWMKEGSPHINGVVEFWV